MSTTTPVAPPPRHDRTFLVIVDESPELSVAIRYASRRAKATGGRVVLLYVQEPVEFQHWSGVSEIMRDEKRQEAEATLQRLSEIVNRISGQIPVVQLREGTRSEEVIKLLTEDKTISILVLAAGTGPEGPGPLVTYVTGKGAGKIKVPITIVPGDLTDEQVDAVT
jgi:nucleotide-binding universal stress UspA family protein